MIPRYMKHWRVLLTVKVGRKWIFGFERGVRAIVQLPLRACGDGGSPRLWPGQGH